MVRVRVVASLVLPLVLLAGCGDDDGDSADDPAPSSDASAGGEPAADAPTGPHPCEVLTGEEVQPVIDAPVTARELDGPAGRQCAYEPGADAPSIKMYEIDPLVFEDPTILRGPQNKDVEELEVEGLDTALMVTDPAVRGSVVAYGGVDGAAYELQVDAGGLGNPAQIAERLLPLIAS